MEEDMANVWGRPSFRTVLEDDELTELLRDAQLQSPEPKDLDNTKEKAKKKKGKEGKEEGRKKKKEKKLDKKTKGVFDLVEPDFVPSSSNPKPSASATQITDIPLSLSAYGESTALDPIDAEDKSARKRSLRFHTSKIESTAARRAHARNAASGGDDDIPYRERSKEREARLKREAEARLKKGLPGQSGDDLEDVEMKGGDEDEKGKGKKRRREEMEEDDNDSDAGGDGYYELVKRQKKDTKEKKKAEYEAEKAAERYVFPTYLDPIN